MLIMRQSIEKIQLTLKKNGRYVGVLLILIGTFLYNDALTPLSKKIMERASDTSQTIPSVAMISPTIHTKQPEKIYEHVMQSKKGDVYRVAFGARGGDNPQVEIFIHSSVFYETIKVGETDVESVDVNEYKEVVFTTPGSFDSIIIKLKEGTRDEGKWSNQFVFTDSFSVSRLDIVPEEISSLAPTIIGIQGLRYARLEDIGRDMLYTFATRSEATDYQDVFEATNSTEFDSKKKSVIAAKRKGEYFMYKFDMMYPITKLVIRATQEGFDEDEIRLQYSFDKSSWRTIEYSQKRSEPQRFLLSLKREIPKEKTVYVKVFYEGEDKKSGTFALKTLSVSALVQKPGY